MALALLRGLPCAATANDCAHRERHALEEDYRSSAQIFVGEVIGCADGQEPVYERCEEQEYLVQVKEAFKGVDENAVLTLQGDRSDGCGLSLSMGSQALTFLDEASRILPQSRLLIGGWHHTKQTRGRVAVLTALRDGRGDLSDPWLAGDSFFGCSLNQPIGEQRVGFGLTTRVETLMLAEGAGLSFTEDGDLAVINPQEPSGDPQIDGQNPPYPTPELAFLVRLNLSAANLPGVGTVTAGGRSWTLEARSEKQFFAGPPEVVGLSTKGSPAREILDAVSQAEDIEVRFRSSAAGSAYESERLVLATKTTHLGAEQIAVFEGCMQER